MGHSSSALFGKDTTKGRVEKVASKQDELEDYINQIKKN